MTGFLIPFGKSPVVRLSQFLNHLKYILYRPGRTDLFLSLQICTPTGISAAKLHPQAATIHSVFGLHGGIRDKYQLVSVLLIILKHFTNNVSFVFLILQVDTQMLCT